jgi:hypothetical protein
MRRWKAYWILPRSNANWAPTDRHGLFFLVRPQTTMFDVYISHESIAIAATTVVDHSDETDALAPC